MRLRRGNLLYLVGVHGYLSLGYCVDCSGNFATLAVEEGDDFPGSYAHDVYRVVCLLWGELYFRLVGRLWWNEKSVSVRHG